MTLTVELDESRTDSGATVSGRVLVQRPLQVQRLSVELRLIERSSSTRTLRRCPKLILAESIELGEGQFMEFSLSLPADAEATWSTGTSQQTWQVLARAEVRGLDHESRADLAVKAAPVEATLQDAPPGQSSERIPTGASEPGGADLAMSAERIAARGQRTNELIGWGLCVAGIGIAVVGLTRLGDEEGGAAVIIGFGGIMALVGLIVVGVYWRSTIRNVTVATDSDNYRPGDRIKVTATNDLGGALRLGYQIVEGTEGRASYYNADRGMSRSKTESVARILHAHWVDLAPGEHNADFVIPDNTIGTAAGKATAISHRVLIVKKGDEENPTPRHATVKSVYVTPL